METYEVDISTVKAAQPRKGYHVKPLDVDFHLNCEETETGSALAVAQWSIRLKNHTFNWSVELSANANVTEAIRFLTDIQKRLIDDARTFEAVHK